MAWWQKKILNFVLSKSGLLDDEAIDKASGGITFGRTSVVHLNNVALKTDRIAKLAQLPPNIRVQTARVLSLRLTIPADFYQSSIVAEAEGIEIGLKLEEQAHKQTNQRKERTASSASTRNPQHRKAHKRSHSPPPHSTGAPFDLDDDAHIPTPQELAEMFIEEESEQELEQMKASFMENKKDMEESVVSEESEGNELGTGSPMGLPGFLAGFLQGISDRLQVRIKNVEAKVETELPGADLKSIPVTLRLSLGTANLEAVDHTSQVDSGSGKKRLDLQNLSLDLLSDAGNFSDLSSHTSRSPNLSEKSARYFDGAITEGSETAKSHRLSNITSMASPRPSAPDFRESIQDSATLGSSRRSHNDATEGGIRPSVEVADLDIRAGEDNISWGSRRSQTSGPVEDLWNSMTSDDELPESLLIDRVPTPRAKFSSSSPTSERRPRSASRDETILQHPGSWPRLDRSSERHELSHSPGSWPTLEQNVRSEYRAQTSNREAEGDHVMDNKMAALELIDENVTLPATLPEPAEDQIADMSQSIMYSHEEAESMYLSAMTQSPIINVPGGWGTDTVASDRSISPQMIQKSNEEDLSQSTAEIGTLESSEHLSGNMTPRPRTPSPAAPPIARDTSEPALLSKRLLSIDLITVWIPNMSDDHGVAGGREESTSRPPVNAGQQRMPGTFSAYSELLASRFPGSTVPEEGQSVVVNQKEPRDRINPSDTLEITFGVVRGQVDISSCRLLYKIATFLEKSSQESTGYSEGRRFSGTPPKRSTTPPISVLVQSLQFSWLSNLPADQPSLLEDARALFTLTCHDMTWNTCNGESDLRLGHLRLLLGKNDLLSFDRQSQVKSSTVLTENTPDISVLFSTNKVMANNRPIMDIHFECLPMEFTMDLEIIEDILSSFGGLSGMIELGSSIISESGRGESPATQKSTKGVRFEGDSAPNRTGTVLKVNGRISGLGIILRGADSAVTLRTASIKAVHREQGTAIYTDRVTLGAGADLAAGPKSSQSSINTPPVSIDIATVRLDYLVSPSNNDLELLLSLLTPSKDKYDNDDDILLDTLLRQRRKGAVAKISVGDVKLKVADFDCIARISALASELSKFSVVADYLPEDERPGILTILRVKSSEGELPVNDRFGKIRIALQDIQVAHVGLPSLLALSVGTVRVFKPGGKDLVHPHIPPTDVENLPMVMTRIVGDEAEPTMKVKLFNVCVEYSVPTILALVNLGEQADGDEVLAEVARSVVDLAPLPRQNSNSSDTAKSETTATSKKRTTIDLLVHESAIGLQPQKSTAKGMFVLTDARVSTLVPPEETLEVSLELRKAAIFLTDSTEVVHGQAERGALDNSGATTRMASFLAKQGYASIGSIMSAKALARISEDASSQAKVVDVDVKNELILLETCADSTQTLIAMMNGLAPPTPPSKLPKYRTEPMPIADMVASFTGDPVSQSEQPPEMLFDADQGSMDSLPMEPTLGEIDAIMADSGMTSSLYGPISGTLDDMDKPDDDEFDADDTNATAESLLEEDPFEMTTAPASDRLSDAALMRDLSRQRKPAISNSPVDLGLWEIEDLGFDPLGTEHQPVGSRHRFNTPKAGKMPFNVTKEGLPFKLRLRDIHIIWNLHDGYDWQHTRNTITQAVEQVETRAEERKARHRQSLNDREDEESVIGDFLFNSVYIGVPNSTGAQDLRRQINHNIDDMVSETESIPVSRMSRDTGAYSASGRPIRSRPRRRLKLDRSTQHKVAFEIKGVSVDLFVYPPDTGEVISLVDVRVRDFEIFDNVPTSTWKKFLTRLDNTPTGREIAKPMAHIELFNVKTIDEYAASEIVLRVSILPLRLHVDQDTLDFITRFFEFKDARMPAADNADGQPFLQRVEVETVDLRLDYKPKHVDYAGIRSGHTTEFMNFVTLDAANIRLKHAILYGIKGFEPLHKTLNDVWMPDVKRYQLPTILAGLAPVRSLVNLGTGVRDVVAIPVREYKKDGRVVRSIQKGAFQFGKTTASELARLGAKMAMGTQTILQGAEGFLSPPASRPSYDTRRTSSEQGWHDVAEDDEDHEPRAISAYANQPLNVLSGLRSARRYLEHDLLTARDALIAVQGEIIESGTPGGAGAAVIRHAPTVILRPIIGASRAMGTALLGVGNQIDRDNVSKVEDKYKRR